MAVPLRERKEIIHFDNDREKIVELTSRISKNFRGLWLLLHRDKEEFGLEICNSWGGELEPDVDSEVRDFIRDFLTKNQNN
jgi:hypothetical protein